MFSKGHQSYIIPHRLIYLILLNCHFIIIPAVSDTEYDGPVSAKMYHHLDSGSAPAWNELALVNFQNIVTGAVTITQKDIDFVERSKILDLINNSSIYRIKVVVTSSTRKETVFHSFIDLGSLIDRKTSNILTISLDQSGSIVGMALSTKESGTFEYSQELNIMDFSLYLAFKPIEQGPLPDTASYVQKIEKEREAKERGVTQDNRSFFAKYWMYIVPIILFAVLSGSTNVDGGNGNNR